MNKERVLQALDNLKGSLETMDYGKWGVLNVEQRNFMRVLCNSWLILDDATNKQMEEIERLNKLMSQREKKWEKWTTEKTILSTKMSDYLCKYQNIKREYTKQIKISTDRKKEIERLNNKVEELMTLYTTEREVKEDYKSIIKEVRELLKNDYFEDGSFTSQEKVFELLDKGE